MKHPHAAQLKDDPGFDGSAALGRVENLPIPAARGAGN